MQHSLGTKMQCAPFKCNNGHISHFHDSSCKKCFEVYLEIYCQCIGMPALVGLTTCTQMINIERKNTTNLLNKGLIIKLELVSRI